MPCARSEASGYEYIVAGPLVEAMAEAANAAQAGQIVLMPNAASVLHAAGGGVAWSVQVEQKAYSRKLYLFSTFTPQTLVPRTLYSYTLHCAPYTLYCCAGVPRDACTLYDTVYCILYTCRAGVAVTLL